MSDYVDVRELLPGYKTVPCEECDAEIYVTQSFSRETWYCREHTPVDVDMTHVYDEPEVRL